MFQPSKTTLALLEDIERRIDPETEEDYARQWEDFLYDRFDGDIFMPQRKKRTPSSVPLPTINVNDTLEDYDLMLQSELIMLSNALNSPSRTAGVWVGGYGTGTLSSILGAEIFVVPRELNTLPTTKPLGSNDRIREAIERGVPDLDTGLGKRAFEFGEILAEVFSKYPKISKYAKVYHPELQGPLDIAELLWGPDMFYAMYDEPELVHALLSLITETFTACMHRWQKIFPCTSDINSYKFYHYRGTLLLRCDSAMNLSPALYKEFVSPYDSLLYSRFGGGAMHFCGKGDHYIEVLSETPGLTAINLTQPQYNDMETIYRNTVDKGIKILALDRRQALRDKDRIGGFKGCVSS